MVSSAKALTVTKSDNMKLINNIDKWLEETNKHIYFVLLKRDRVPVKKS